jgi:hypothetical protein
MAQKPTKKSIQSVEENLFTKLKIEFKVILSTAKGVSIIDQVSKALQAKHA